MEAAADPDGTYSHQCILGRIGTAEEVAALIAYLLGDESRFTTGAAYSIDGGANC